MRLAVASAVVSCLLVAGCGGSGDDSSSADALSANGATLEELWRAPGDDVAVLPGTEHHLPGDVRVSFVVIDGQGRPIVYPTARVWVARGLDVAPFLESTAKLERIGVPGGAEASATHIYVAHLRLPTAGTYWLLAEPEGRVKVQALGNVAVSESDPPPDVGEAAPKSDTPTLATVGGDASKITTRVPPDETLLQYSVAESIAARVPFVVTFASPKFCESRTCGPDVDVVEEVARRFEGEDVRFIHVEVYANNDPARGYNRWMREWGLTTEPWTFVVGADGKVAERYEGVVSVNELEQAVDDLLEGRS